MKNLIWTLKAKEVRRFAQGHPWVFSNELQQSPKGVAPGQWVELRDPGGKFLARGFGSAHSLIAFRAVTRDPAESEASSDLWQRRMRDAWNYREILGLTHQSFRWIFGEADRIPGLIVDAYKTVDAVQCDWVIVAQAHSAGADRFLNECLQAALKILPSAKVAVIVRNDVSIRDKEGIPIQKPVFWESSPVRLASGVFRVQLGAVDLEADLLNGQKTGLFLDQAENIRRAIQYFVPRFKGKKNVRILDLCSYVGQWSVQIGVALKKAGVDAHLTAVDVSKEALERARGNAERAGLKLETIQGNVLKDLESIESNSFDWIVCDPPALVPSRKDLPQGRHAYLQVNTQMFRLLKPSGVWISCSCSALLPEEDLIAAIDKAARRNGAWVLVSGYGGQSLDHPTLPAFPEGRYLKAVFGILGEKSEISGNTLEHGKTKKEDL